MYGNGGFVSTLCFGRVAPKKSKGAVNSRAYFDTGRRGKYDPALMSDGRLPERIDPHRLAEGKRILQGSLELNTMPRLGAYLTGSGGKVQVEMEFGRDEEGIPFVRGHLETEVEIACQRCMGSFRLPLQSRFLLGVVSEEKEADRLPEHYDPLVAGHEPVVLKDLVEDELILSLPIVPRHPEGECPAPPVERDEPESKRENPFSVLAHLKTNSNS